MVLANSYNQYAGKYVALLGQRDERDDLTSRLLAQLDPVSGQNVLDAGCGAGHIARILARRGAQVVGMDIASRLVEWARVRDAELGIDYRTVDLSQPLPEWHACFDQVASHLVLNDVPEFRGFVATMGSVLKPGGRIVLSLNNLYSFVVRKQVPNYFESGFNALYRGLSARGLRVRFYHRTLEEYIGAFHDNGMFLEALVDVPFQVSDEDGYLPMGDSFPYFLILKFIKRNVSRISAEDPLGE